MKSNFYSASEDDFDMDWSSDLKYYLMLPMTTPTSLDTLSTRASVSLPRPSVTSQEVSLPSSNAVKHVRFL